MEQAKQNFNPETFDLKTYDALIARGLSSGVGKRDGQMCIEAVICTALGLPHGDDPQCVAASVRSFKIALNDKKWSSPEARAAGLRDLGLAQLGSLGVVSDKDFVKKLSEKLIRVLIPTLLRELYPQDSFSTWRSAKILGLALRCELEGTIKVARETRDFLQSDAAADAAAAASAAAYAAYAAYDAADAADAAAAFYPNAASAAAYAAYAAAAAAAAAGDKYLKLGASLALEVLRDLKSPGCQLLEGV